MARGAGRPNFRPVGTVRAWQSPGQIQNQETEPMFNDRNRTYSGACCVDCLMLLANGETPEYMTGDEVADYLARVERMCAGSEVTLGMFREDHGCVTDWTVTWHAPGSVRGSFRRGQIEVRADSYGDAMDQARWSHETPAYAWPVMARSHELETEYDRGGECFCEQLGFSWSACDVCGSDLGGDREAVVFWFGEETSDRSEPDPAPIPLAAPSSDQHHDPLVQAVTDRFNEM